MKRVAKRLLSPEIGEIPTAPQHADREMYEFFVDWRKNIGRRADNSKFFLEGLTYLGKHNPDKRGADNEKWIGDLLGIDMSSINVEKMNHSYPGKKDPSMSSSRYGVRYENDIRLLRNPFWTLKLEVFVQNYDPQTDDCINDINAIIRTKANPDSSWPELEVNGIYLLGVTLKPTAEPVQPMPGMVTVTPMNFLGAVFFGTSCPNDSDNHNNPGASNMLLDTEHYLTSIHAITANINDIANRMANSACTKENARQLHTDFLRKQETLLQLFSDLMRKIDGKGGDGGDEGDRDGDGGGRGGGHDKDNDDDDDDNDGDDADKDDNESRNRSKKRKQGHISCSKGVFLSCVLLVRVCLGLLMVYSCLLFLSPQPNVPGHSSRPTMLTSRERNGGSNTHQWSPQAMLSARVAQIYGIYAGLGLEQVTPVVDTLFQRPPQIVRPARHTMMKRGPPIARHASKKTTTPVSSGKMKEVSSNTVDSGGREEEGESALSPLGKKGGRSKEVAEQDAKQDGEAAVSATPVAAHETFSTSYCLSDRVTEGGGDSTDGCPTEEPSLLQRVRGSIEDSGSRGAMEGEVVHTDEDDGSIGVIEQPVTTEERGVSEADDGQEEQEEGTSLSTTTHRSTTRDGEL